MANKKKSKGGKKMPQVRKVRGKGDYSEEIKQLSNPLQRIERKIDHVNSFVDKGKTNAGGLIGRGLGTLIGNGDLGEQAGSSLAKWFGYGDYELKTNSLMKIAAGVSSGNTIPVFSKDGRRGTRVAEREYLGDIISSGTANTFNLQSFRLNPGDPVTFPWLSTIASQFEEYEMHGLIFEFKTTSAMFNGSTQALGTVTMATEYDPSDTAYQSLIEMQNADYSCSTVSCNNMQHGVECDPMERPTRVLYVSVDQPGASDVRFCDMGKFQVATSGVAGTSVNLGQLWVSYDVTFYKKQLISGPAAIRDVTVRWTDGTATIPSTPFGTTTTRTAYGTLPLSFNSTGNKFQLTGVSSGRYLMVFSLFMNSITNTGAPTLTYTNAAAYAATNYASLSSTGATTNRITFVQAFDVTGLNPTVQVNLAGVTLVDMTNFTAYLYVLALNPSTLPSETINYSTF